MTYRYNRRNFLLAASAVAIATGCQSRSTQSDRQGFVALEWVYAENLLALGIAPKGLADIRGYQQYVNIPTALNPNTTDVGTRQEPSLEAIASLNPQMIFGTQLRHETIYQDLSKIASTKLYNPYPEPGQLDQFQEMEQTFLSIAELTNQHSQGEQVLAQLRDRLSQASKSLSRVPDRPILLGQFLGNTPQLRLFTDNSMAMRILNQMSLRNAWQGQPDRYGFNTVWLEALPAVQKAHFLYVAPENDAEFKKLQNNPIWQELEFVRENRLASLGSDTWLFGGPLSAQVIVERVIAALTKKP
ncbi:iron-siderophore ABC transporter substrate-binding protein [Leptolyngbya sp. FACHB-17]|uniref:ABC transporter substrate-binding protein n=1 Tax=unclassified Leptolyngbya TaxID=2650499 RepID=UPI0016815DC6|nr:iron-siderophore ABC transporter substrate-binding protein [Leptolyngbya sp. FACHB-17]MBD2078970.1 iron-siderophore ABC transporter substrate-binding protein [Leptolyngbya sp. FACHB-17]